MGIGQMFLHFPLHPEAQKCCGVNLIGIMGVCLPIKNTRLVLTMMWMDFRPSSARVVRNLHHAEDIAKVNHLHENDHFH